MIDFEYGCVDKYAHLIDLEDKDCVGSAKFVGCTWEFTQLDCWSTGRFKKG